MQGYVRVHPYQRDDAVLWWYIREFEDGFVFANGGAVRTARRARQAINQCDGQASAAHRRFVERPVARLRSDGSLEEISYGPYEPIALR